MSRIHTFVEALLGNGNGNGNGLFKLFTVETELQAGVQKDIYKLLV